MSCDDQVVTRLIRYASVLDLLVERRLTIDIIQSGDNASEEFQHHRLGNRRFYSPLLGTMCNFLVGLSNT